MALSTTGISAKMGNSTSREVIASYWVNGLNVKVYDDVVTTIEEYHGMPETEALALAESLKSNSMSDYCIRSGSTAPFSWIRCPQAQGTKVNASSRRVGTSRMFTVTKTTEVHTCSNSAGWSTYTP